MSIKPAEAEKKQEQSTQDANLEESFFDQKIRKLRQQQEEKSLEEAQSHPVYANLIRKASQKPPNRKLPSSPPTLTHIPTSQLDSLRISNTLRYLQQPLSSPQYLENERERWALREHQRWLDNHLTLLRSHRPSDGSQWESRGVELRCAPLMIAELLRSVPKALPPEENHLSTYYATRRFAQRQLAFSQQLLHKSQ